MDALSFWMGAASAAALIAVIASIMILVREHRETRKEAAKPQPLLGVVQPKDRP